MVEVQAALEIIEYAVDCEHADIAACPHFRRVLDESVAAGAGALREAVGTGLRSGGVAEP
ncbi:hypothetical protein ABT324_29985 [Saccharopolyspora sp. NPDC000359]|uniref:hypothetical protein n=1 Tax=Saccharopolyspora sp. NPDC000359 TaxID=3154251 RepID=UPI0033181489